MCVFPQVSAERCEKPSKVLKSQQRQVLSYGLSHCAELQYPTHPAQGRLPLCFMIEERAWIPPVIFLLFTFRTFQPRRASRGAAWALLFVGWALGRCCEPCSYTACRTLPSSSAFVCRYVRSGQGSISALAILICSVVQLRRDVGGLWKKISHGPWTCRDSWCVSGVGKEGIYTLSTPAVLQCGCKETRSRGENDLHPKCYL